MAAHLIRPAEPRDFPAILALARCVAEAGDAFPWEQDVSDEELAFYWLPNPTLRLETFVAEADDGGRGGLSGACVLHPAAGGRGGHGAHGAFAVDPAARGRGLGKRLCTHIVEEARRTGYSSMRFNMVVASNVAAVRVCLACGFKLMCTLPRVFQHPVCGLVDAHVMFCGFDEGKQAPAPRQAAATPAAAVVMAPRLSLPVPGAAVPTAPRASLPAGRPPSPAGNAAAASTARAGSPAVPGLRYLRAPLPGAEGAGAEEVRLEPYLGGLRLTGGAFAAQAALPEGLQLDPATGVISGVLRRGRGGSGASEASASHRVTATFTVELRLQAEGFGRHSDGEGRVLSCGDSRAESEAGQPEVATAMLINEDFAARLEHVVDVADLLPEPPRTRAYGDWMIWMVHRAFLDDPSLVQLDFTNMHMPPGHIEKRIAPKLMAAIATNTHLELLSLSNSNMQKIQGVELGSSLLHNKTLLEVNLEGNFLDPTAVRDLALAINANPGCRIEHFRVSHQKQMGQFFGRLTEEAMGRMMDGNKTIVKLGFECDDANWRNVIDRALLRNNDYWRRRQLGPSPEEVPAGEERTLGQVLLHAPPERPMTDLFPEEAASHATFRVYVVQNRKMPTTSQLQSNARNSGTSMTYAVAAPLIKECRSRMLDAAAGKEVVVTDAFGTEAKGILRGWSEVNEQWTFDIWAGEGKRCIFKASREPGFSVSPAWVDWLRGAGRHASRAGA